MARCIHLIFALSITLSGCNEDENEQPVPDAGVLDQSQLPDGPSRDRTSADGIPSEDQGSDLPSIQYFGVVNIYKNVQGTGLQVGSAHVAAVEETDPCEGATERDGDCCFTPPTSGNPPLVPPGVDAGRITIKSGAGGTTLVELEYAPSFTTYPSSQWTTPTWTAGDQVTASAPGAMAPAFTVSTSGPDLIGGVSPAWEESTVEVPLVEDLTISWTPDPNAQSMELLMAAQSNNDNIIFRGGILCTVPDAQGTLVVPASLLAKFEPGDICYSCGLFRSSRQITTSHQAQVTLKLTTISVGNVTFK